MNKNYSIIKKEENKKILLDDIDKTNIEFLIKLYFYYIELNNKIRQSLMTNNQDYKKGFVVNGELIEKYKIFYEYDIISGFLKDENNQSLINRYKNLYHLNEEQMNNFLNELLPKNFKQLIQSKDNKKFFEDLNTNYKIYSEIIKSYDNKGFLYFDNCVVIDENLVEYLVLNKEEKIKNILNNFQVLNIVFNNKLIIFYNLVINIGILENNIFKAETIISCSGEESINILKNEIKLNGYVNIIKNINIIQDNIGKINGNGNDIIVFLNDNYMDNIMNKKDNLLSNQNYFNKDNKAKKDISAIKDSNKKKDAPFLTKVLFSQPTNNLKHNFNNKKLPSNPDYKIENNNKKRERNKSIDTSKKLNKEIKNAILVLIDLVKLKIRINIPLNQYNDNNYQEYYPLDFDWFKNYLEFNNIDKIYNHLLNNKIIENIINSGNVSKEKIMEKINAENMLVNKNKNRYQNFQRHNYLYPIQKENIKKGKEFCKYYHNFILLNADTIKLFDNKLYSTYVKFLCILGDNRIIIIFNENNTYFIEIGFLNEKYIFIPELLLDFFNNNYIKININLMIKNTYKEYIKSFMIFNNDSTSPVFDVNNNIIGNAFKDLSPNKDYTNYLINKNLIIMVKLYFNYSQLILNSKKVKKGKFYLINSLLMEKYRNYCEYSNIEEILNQNKLNPHNIFSLISNSINNNRNDGLIDDKKITFIIKCFLNNFNIKLNSKMNSNDKIIIYKIEEPNIEYLENMSIYYYNKFELISESIYISLFDKYNNNSNEKMNNYVNCIVLNNYIFFEIPKSYIQEANEYIVEVAMLNASKIFYSTFLLIYDNKERFMKDFMPIFDESLEFEEFLNKQKLNDSNEIQQIYDINGKPSGIIFNLNIIKQNKISSLKQTNNQNLSNDNGSNKNLSSNISNIISNNNDSLNNNLPNNYNKNLFNFQFNNVQNNGISNISNININLNLNQKSNNINNIPNNKVLQNRNSPNIQKILNSKSDNVIKINKLIKNEFPIPPLIGLQNVGTTSYMNATLQCLSQIEKLTNYFKYDNWVNKVIKNYKSSGVLCLTESYKYLIENLWPSNYYYTNNQDNHKNSNNSYYAPYGFKKKISNMNPLFQGVAANDAKDLVNFIIMTLHEELNKVKNTTPSSTSNIEIDQTNQNDIFQLFLQNFINENKSIISDLFYATTTTETQCSGCTTKKYNFQTYFFLIFPLEEIRKFKIANQMMMNMNQNMMNMNMLNMNSNIMNPMMMNMNSNINFNFNQNNFQNINSVNFIDCFDFNQKMEYFTGDNSMYCNICKQQLPACYQTFLYTAPEILIIVLNRGKGIEFKVKMEFTEILDLSQYVIRKETGCFYNLIGVVTHMGESGASGHFIACCKSPINGKWYNYNDDLVTEVLNFKQDVIDYAMPYILFYQKKNNSK